MALENPRNVIFLWFSVLHSLAFPSRRIIMIFPTSQACSSLFFPLPDSSIDFAARVHLSLTLQRICRIFLKFFLSAQFFSMMFEVCSWECGKTTSRWLTERDGESLNKNTHNELSSWLCRLQRELQLNLENILKKVENVVRDKLKSKWKFTIVHSSWWEIIKKNFLCFGMFSSFPFAPEIFARSLCHEHLKVGLLLCCSRNDNAAPLQVLAVALCWRWEDKIQLFGKLSL